MLLCIICGHNVPFKMKFKASTARVNRSASGGSNDTSKSCKQVNKQADINDEILIHKFWAQKFELILGAKFKCPGVFKYCFFLMSSHPFLDDRPFIKMCPILNTYEI